MLTGLRWTQPKAGSRAEPYLLADVLRLGVLPEVVPRVCLLVRLLGDPHRGLQVRPDQFLQ